MFGEKHDNSVIAPLIRCFDGFFKPNLENAVQCTECTWLTF